MEIQVIRIGNSKGILLSKVLLEQYKFGEKIEIVMKPNHLELRPVKSVRQGWEKKFKEMHEQGEDSLLIDDLPEDEELEEWK
jgi:antitoxin MazE